MQLGSTWRPNLGQCWTLFSLFFGAWTPLLSWSRFGIDFSLVLEPLVHWKLSSRLHVNQILYIFMFLCWARFWLRFWSSTCLQNRAQEAPKLDAKRREKFKLLPSGFWAQLGPNLASKRLPFWACWGSYVGLMLWPQRATPEIPFKLSKCVRFGIICWTILDHFWHDF